MRIVRILVASVVLAGLSACEMTTNPTTQPLTVTSDGTQLTLENKNPWTIYYMAIDPNSLAQIDYVLCDNPNFDCPRVPALGSVRVPYTNIVGYHDGLKQVLVMQWRLQRRVDGTYLPTGGTSTTISLQ